MVKVFLVLAAMLFFGTGIAAGAGGATVAPVNAPTVQATPLAAPEAASAASGAQAPGAASQEGLADNGNAAPQQRAGLTSTVGVIMICTGLLIVFALGLWLANKRKTGGVGRTAQGPSQAAPRREPGFGESEEAA